MAGRTVLRTVISIKIELNRLSDGDEVATVG